jgi:hypothetical protein
MIIKNLSPDSCSERFLIYRLAGFFKETRKDGTLYLFFELYWIDVLSNLTKL